MAQRVQVILIDDIDHGPADETVQFAVEGVQYQIDLSAAHAAQLRADFAPWVAAARKVPARASGKARSAASSDTSKIRAWAKANGHEVSERGRISATVRAAYDAAH